MGGPPDVDFNFDDLRTMTTNLGTFVDEFDKLASSNEQVQNAVGNPAGYSDLSGRVHEFESGWDGNRKTMLDSLKNVHDHLKSIVDGFAEVDTKMGGSGR